MLRKILPLLACLILIGGEAGAAIIASSDNGDWNNPRTWVGRVVPGSGDTAQIYHTVTVTDGTNPVWSTLSMQAGGALIFEGTNTLEDVITHANGEITIRDGATVSFETTSTPHITVSGAGAVFTMEGDARIVSATGSHGAADRLLLNATNGTINLDGKGPIGPAFKVASVPFTSNSSGNDLSVTTTTVIPDDITHARLEGGRLSGLIFEVERDGERALTLKNALRQPYNAGCLIVTGSSAFDSLIVTDSVVQPADMDSSCVVGGLVLVDDGKSVGMVERVFRSAGSFLSALFVRADVSAAKSDWTPTETYIVTTGIHNGATLTPLKMVRLDGASTEPTSDNIIEGSTSQGKSQARRISLSSTATLDARYAAFKWIAATNYAIALNNTGTNRFANCAFFGLLALYGLDATTTTSQSNLTLVNCSALEILGGWDLNHGHFMRTNDTNDNAIINLDGVVVVGTKDDFLYMEGGVAALNVNNCAHIDWGGGNFIDFGTGIDVDSLVVTNNFVMSRECPLYFDEGDTVSIDNVSHNLFVGGGRAWNADALHDSTAAGGEEQGYMRLGTPTYITEFSCVSDTARWGGVRTLDIQNYGAAADTIRFKDLVFENYNNWVDFGGSVGRGALNDANVRVTGVYWIGNDPVSMEGCRFLNPYRRGFDTTAQSRINNNSQQGLSLAPAGDAVFEIKQCFFTDVQSSAEGYIPATSTTFMFWLMAADANAILWVSDNMFYYVEKIAYIANGTQNTFWTRNYMLQAEDDNSAPVYNLFRYNATSGIVFNYNAVLWQSDDQTTGTAVRFDNTAVQIKGNIFINSADGGDEALLHFPTDAEMDATPISYNVFCGDADNEIYTTSAISVATMEGASTAGSTGNVAVADTSAWRQAVSRIDNGTLRLVPGGSAVNIVTGDTDPDGTVADAGPKALDNRRSSIDTLPGLGGDVGGYLLEPHFPSISPRGGGGWTPGPRYNFNDGSDYSTEIASLAAQNPAMVRGNLGRVWTPNGHDFFDDVWAALPNGRVPLIGYLNVNHARPVGQSETGSGMITEYKETLYDNAPIYSVNDSISVIWDGTTLERYVNFTTGVDPFVINNQVIADAFDTWATYTGSDDLDYAPDIMFWDYTLSTPRWDQMSDGTGAAQGWSGDDLTWDLDNDGDAEASEAAGGFVTGYEYLEEIWKQWQRNWFYGWRRKFGTAVRNCPNMYSNDEPDWLYGEVDGYFSERSFMVNNGFRRWGPDGGTILQEFEALKDSIDNQPTKFFFLDTWDGGSATSTGAQDFGDEANDTQGQFSHAAACLLDIYHGGFDSDYTVLEDMYDRRLDTGSGPLGPLILQEDTGYKRYLRQYTNGWVRVRFNTSTGDVDSVAIDP